MNFKPKAKHCLPSWCRYPLWLEKFLRKKEEKQKNKFTHFTPFNYTDLFCPYGRSLPKKHVKKQYFIFEIGHNSPTTSLLLTFN